MKQDRTPYTTTITTTEFIATVSPSRTSELPTRLASPWPRSVMNALLATVRVRNGPFRCALLVTACFLQLVSVNAQFNCVGYVNLSRPFRSRRSYC
jgi:hypothetical protein